MPTWDRIYLGFLTVLVLAALALSVFHPAGCLPAARVRGLEAPVAAVAPEVIPPSGPRFPAPDLGLTQPAITLPEDLTVPVGEMIEVTATTTGKVVCWEVQDGISFRVHGDNGLILAGKTPGRYRVLAWTALDGIPTAAARTTVVVGDAPEPSPVPPGPMPGPLPVPIPVPVPLPFAQALQQAWKAELAPDKAARRQILAEVYRKIAVAIAQDPTLNTRAKVYDRQRVFVQGFVGDWIKGVRAVIDAELARTLAGLGTVDDAGRKKAAGEINRMAAALGELK